MPKRFSPLKVQSGGLEQSRVCLSGVYLEGQGVASPFPPINALFYKHIHSIQVPLSGISMCPCSKSVNTRQLLVPQFSEAKQQ